MANQIFVNLAVKNLPASMDYFKGIGFTFNPKFTNDSGACMEIGPNIYAMLLTEPFFSTFTTKGISDSSQTTEAIIALSAENRQEVDELADKAIAGGGTAAKPTTDYGWMYSRNFYDIDGHHWEIFYMDEAAAPKAM
ncbi:VOC family protein [Deminuibacter soli]|uniref:Glyoxalase/bleomycin resistance/extradiol dioxygenase family protein n=1 Tax=Deminuibacter soli TaxID=2291815 RepID=A0A3E1NCC8_9BACT|nr:VOC family protein [Deminuibacter soli]RFM25669.1 glyoxalase/bleomycin resistance/extradiol dioxygenase family protein [Deminuibacter soli]